MIILAGLGNPGQKYARHRHNVGFMAVDRIAAHFDFPAWSKKFQGLVTNGRIGGDRVVLLKPQTMMNASGRSVSQAVRFYRVETENLVVFHDELDLAPGKVRIKTGGGTAGHNGLRSIDEHLGKNFRRVRIGIGHPGDKSRVIGHVLGNFASSDADWLDPLLDAMARSSPSIIEGDDAAFMNGLARLRRAEEAPRARSEKVTRHQETDPVPESPSLFRQLLERWRG